MILIVRVPVKPKNSKVSNIDRTKRSRLNRKIEPRPLKALVHKASRRFAPQNTADYPLSGRPAAFFRMKLQEKIQRSIAHP